MSDAANSSLKLVMLDKVNGKYKMVVKDGHSETGSVGFGVFVDLGNGQAITIDPTIIKFYAKGFSTLPEWKDVPDISVEDFDQHA